MHACDPCTVTSPPTKTKSSNLVSHEFICMADVENPEKKEERELLLSLPKVKSWDLPYLHYYQGFWLEPRYFHGIYSFQKHFQAKDTDIILATFPKSGTTWLKALAFAVVNRSRYTLENSPLITSQPHDVVHFVDLQIYGQNRTSILEHLPEPRILATHVPYPSLPTSIINSNCRIVYLCRNPLDQFVSTLLFAPEFRKQVMEPVSMDETFEMLCQGIQCFGPSWDHVLGYRKASLEKPNKVLFLTYEDLKEDINFHLKKMADFSGCPFTEEEETQGVVEDISKFCSFGNLKNLEVNQTGKLAHTDIQNKIFFRKGDVGDWTNHLPPSMSERLKKLMDEKLGESGLVTFKYN